jgi:REP-associated tyrosine transposase
MPNIKIWVHCVWSTEKSEFIIPDKFRPAILSHMRENAKVKRICLDSVNLHKEHVHVLLEIKEEQSVTDLIDNLKGESSEWINKLRLFPSHFAWQQGYLAVSVSPALVGKVRVYIKNQDRYHRGMSWDKEIGIFLERSGFEKSSV